MKKMLGISLLILSLSNAASAACTYVGSNNQDAKTIQLLLKISKKVPALRAQMEEILVNSTPVALADLASCGNENDSGINFDALRTYVIDQLQK